MLFKTEYEELLKEDPDSRNRRIADFITEKIKVEYYYNNIEYVYEVDEEEDNKWKSFYSSKNMFPMEITWYDEVIDFGYTTYYASNRTSNKKKKRDLKVWDEILDFDLAKYILDNEEELVFEYVNGDKKYKFIIDYANINIETMEIIDSYWYVLVWNASE